MRAGIRTTACTASLWPPNFPASPVQSLRLYERHGLLTPTRSDGGTRRYSADDLARLQRISALVDAGVNLAGIARILNLEDDNAELSAANTDLRSTNRSLRNAAKE